MHICTYKRKSTRMSGFTHMRKSWARNPHKTDLAVHTGWRKINRTIQPFNGVYENLHKITPLTLVTHKQIRRLKRNVHLNILRKLILHMT